MTLRLVRDRLYSDFMLPSRLALYRTLLQSALAAGYEVISVEAMWRLVTGPDLDPNRRYLVLRHDVDTDSRTAAAMWAVDRALGIRPSYYFRLSTMAPALMASIAEAGGEASYHYEELATVAKRRGLRTPAAAERHLPEAREEFARNLASIRSLTGLGMPVVSSHGDFVNRRLGLPNWVLLADDEFRKQTGVGAEAYDSILIGRMTSQHSDLPYPRFWVPGNPAAAIRAGDPVVYVLVHPRHWHVDRLGNLRDDLQRATEGVRYELAGLRQGTR